MSPNFHAYILIFFQLDLGTAIHRKTRDIYFVISVVVNNQEGREKQQDGRKNRKLQSCFDTRDVGKGNKFRANLLDTNKTRLYMY